MLEEWLPPLTLPHLRVLGERAVADCAMTFQARSKIRSQVIAKSAGSEEPVFTSMDVLF
jgi:hypothetical protein